MKSGANVRVTGIIKADGQTYSLGHSDIAAGGVKVKYRVLPNMGVVPGGVCAADLSLVLTNKDGRFNEVMLNYSEVVLSVGVEVGIGVYENIPLGIFEVDTVDRMAVTFDRDYKSIPLQAADRMIRFDIPFSSVQVTYPCTAKQLLTLICQRCHVPIGMTSFTNEDYSIQAPPEGDIPCRDVISYIAELAGCWAQCDRNGMLVFRWFKNPQYIQGANLDGGTFALDGDGNYFDGDTVDGGDFSNWFTSTYDGGSFAETKPDWVITSGLLYDFGIDDAPITITGVGLETEDETFLVGTQRYAVILDNPLINHEIKETLSTIHSKIAGFTYIPFHGVTYDNPAMEAGDMLFLDNIEGKSYRTVLTEYEYVFNGRSRISATGESEREHNYKSPSQRQFSRLLRKIGEKQTQINALDDAIINGTQMLANAMGGQWFNGNDIGYPGEVFIATSSDLTATTTRVWRYNINGYGYYPEGLNGPATTGATADNSMWANLITAAMIQTGILRSLNGKSWIDMDNGTFNLGDGALVFNGTQFEAVSAKKLTTPGSLVEGVIGGVGGYPGLELYNTSFNNRVGLFPALDGFSLWVKKGNETISTMLLADITMAYIASKNQQERIMVDRNNGVSFRVNGQIYGYSGVVPENGKPNFVNGICMGWS